MKLRRFAGAGAIASACALLMVPLGAVAQTSGTPSLTTSIREISFDSKGNTNIVVSVAGSALSADQTLAASDFSVTESGQAVQGLTVQRLSQTGAAIPVAVALVFDISGSTAGAPLAAAKTAAKDFVAALPPNVRVALISFGTNVNVVRSFTTDHSLLTSGINGLVSDDNTSLFDGVLAGSALLDRQSGVQRNMVVFTDGHDTTSKATLGQAVAALHAAGTATTAVLLGTSTADFSVLQRLAGAAKGGAALRAANLSGLHDAFGRAAQALTSQYILTYTASDTTTKDLNISVAATAGGITATDSSVVLNARNQVQASSPPSLRPPDKPIVSAFGGSLGLYLGIAAAFLGVLLFFGMLLYAPAGKASERALQRRLRLYTRGGDRKQKKEQSSSLLGGTALGRGAVSFVERLPRSKDFDEKLQVELDKAGWPLRSSEFVLLQVGGFIAGILIGWALFQRLWLGVVFAVLGVIVPRFLLGAQISRRTSSFLSQLPDTLQLLAGSLQAGYGFLQALDTVAKEAAPPTSTEFARVLSEARLGRPIDEALDGMAERVGGEDFKWVVLAINIQRQVGGNLAQLLTTVANTLREREQVRRQIKVLSAEGRLSAYILVALPFVLFGYLSIINPDYIHQLTQETIGKIMMIGALVLIGVGAVWMRKVVNIDV